jgi:hypothetical protein
MSKIIEAYYEMLDVKNILNKYIINNKLYIQVSNNIFTDPTPGIKKKLYLKYIDGITIKEKYFNELDIIDIEFKEDFEEIKKDINNIFFYWDGSISKNRMILLKDVLYSTRIFNESRPIYLISNTIEQDDLENIFNINVVKWYINIFDKSGIPEELLKEKYFKCGPREFSDLLRLVLMHKYGGSYIDTDDICINKLSTQKNIICRSYDPHTCFYNNLTSKDCIDGKYREIRGYDNIPMFPRNDCWQNFESEHYILKELLYNEKFLNSNNVISICDNFSWQSLSLDAIKNNIEKINIDFIFGLTLLYLYEGHVSVSSLYDRCEYGGEMCDIYNTLPDINNYSWGNYKCDINVAKDFYKLILERYSYISNLWMHSKDNEEEWFIDINENSKYSLTTWIYYFIKEKIKEYKNENNKKFSVIIPTLWKSNFIYKLLDELDNCNYVGEIIIIDNNNKYNDKVNKNYNKIKVLSYIDNQYVNPSWNIGVLNSKYDNICICNDDINFETRIFEFVSNLSDCGIIGMDINSLYEKDINKTLYIEKINERLSCWGCLLFIKKQKWVNIPEQLKVACGDDYLLQKLKDNAYIIRGLKAEGEVSKTSLNFSDVADEDIKIYKNYIEKVNISILTLTYKRHHILEEAIQSFLNQNFENESEMVIINDSSDVEYVYDNPRVRIINCKERFSSISKKIEFGYKQCKYNYIYRLDDDDLLAPNALKIVKKQIDEYPLYDIYRSTFNYTFINDNFKYISGNINTGNIYTKKYLDNIEFPDISVTEDVKITFEMGGNISECDYGHYTMIYRWNVDTYHISTLNSQTPNNNNIFNYVDNKINNNSENGIINLNPHFNKNYYSELPTFRIIKANYGSHKCVIDVTNILNDKIANNSISFIAGNQLFGDPCPGVHKTLKIKYYLNNNIIEKEYIEGNNIKIN